MRDMRHSFCGFKWSKKTEKEIKEYMQSFIKAKTIINKNGCWIWQGSLSKWGYGDVRIGPVGQKKHVNVHKAAWLYFKGKVPQGLFVCHRCDVRSCCNPDHLFLGTAKQNQHDMISKGRDKQLRGSECPWSKINEEVVLKILELCKKGLNCAEIGKQLNICKKQISDIKRGRRWGHVGDRSGIAKIKPNKIILDEDKVRKIKRRFAEGARIRTISLEYGINETTIADIKHGRTWKHVTI